MSVTAIVTLIVVVLVTLNVILTSIKKILDRFAANSEADALVGKAAGFLSMLIGLITSNSGMLPQEAKDVLSGKDPVAASPAQPAQGS